MEVQLNTDCEADHSLPSADDGSSGYESFAAKECDSPVSSEGDVNRNYSASKINPATLRKSLFNTFSTTPSIGKSLFIYLCPIMDYLLQ